MHIIRYVTPSSLVVPLGVNIDTLIIISLYTIFHPIPIWIFTLFDHSWRTYASLITSFWIIRAFNLSYKATSRSLPTNSAKSVFITGGSNGLGYEIVKQLCLEDDVSRIIVVDLVGRVEFKVMEKVMFIPCNLEEGIEKIILNTKINLKDVDVLICNAGVRQHNPLSGLSMPDMERIINANWISHTKLIKQYIDAIEHTENDRRLRRRHIMVVGSVLGYVGPKGLGIYASTKAAMAVLMEALRAELPQQFVISTILPGQLNSQMFADVTVNEFLAPVVDIQLLSGRIVEIIRDGLNGTFAYPVYGRFLSVYRVMPWFLQRFCRWLSNMDNV